MPKFVDLAGEKFGRLIAVRRTGTSKSGYALWLCICDCGKTIVVRGNNLTSSNTKSCGCFQKDRTVEINTTHGHGKKGQRPKIYKSWHKMIQRCINPNHKAYHNYGGRGITVCKRWRKFENFLEDMGEHPGKEYSIDRIDNNGNYCKSNCRWVTRKEQNRNKRNNHLITYNGKTQCISAWAEELGIGASVLWYRLKHWSVKKALTTPVRKRRK